MRVIVVLFVTLAACLSGSHAKKKSSFTAKTVQSIVEQEILKKIPAVKGRKLHKLSEEERTSLNGVHLKEATDAINKLVDESIVDRVQEAEKEVSQMLLKSIEHHIQDAGKVLLRQDENSCSDKIASCQQLSESGVCASSKDAMVINCPKTCNFCDILEGGVGKDNVVNKEEEIKEDTQAEEPLKKTPVKKIHKSKKQHKKKAKKHHHKSVAQAHAAPAPAPAPAAVAQTQTGLPVPIATVAQPVPQPMPYSQAQPSIADQTQQRNADARAEREQEAEAEREEEEKEAEEREKEEQEEKAEEAAEREEQEREEEEKVEKAEKAAEKAEAEAKAAKEAKEALEQEQQQEREIEALRKAKEKQRKKKKKQAFSNNEGERFVDSDDNEDEKINNTWHEWHTMNKNAQNSFTRLANSDNTNTNDKQLTNEQSTSQQAPNQNTPLNSQPQITNMVSNSFGIGSTEQLPKTDSDILAITGDHDQQYLDLDEATDKKLPSSGQARASIVPFHRRKISNMQHFSKNINKDITKKKNVHKSKVYDTRTAHKKANHKKQVNAVKQKTIKLKHSQNFDDFQTKQNKDEDRIHKGTDRENNTPAVKAIDAPDADDLAEFVPLAVKPDNASVDTTKLNQEESGSIKYISKNHGPSKITMGEQESELNQNVEAAQTLTKYPAPSKFSKVDLDSDAEINFVESQVQENRSHDQSEEEEGSGIQERKVNESREHARGHKMKDTKIKVKVEKLKTQIEKLCKNCGSYQTKDASKLHKSQNEEAEDDEELEMRELQKKKREFQKRKKNKSSEMHGISIQKNEQVNEPESENKADDEKIKNNAEQNDEKGEKQAHSKTGKDIRWGAKKLKHYSDKVINQVSKDLEKKMSTSLSIQALEEEGKRKSLSIDVIKSKLDNLVAKAFAKLGLGSDSKKRSAVTKDHIMNMYKESLTSHASIKVEPHTKHTSLVGRRSKTDHSNNGLLLGKHSPAVTWGKREFQLDVTSNDFQDFPKQDSYLERSSLGDDNEDQYEEKTAIDENTSNFLLKKRSLIDQVNYLNTREVVGRP